MLCNATSGCAGECYSCRWPMNVKAAGKLHKHSQNRPCEVDHMGIQDFRPVSTILLLNDPANSVQRVVYHWRVAEKPWLPASSDTPVQ